MQRNTDMHMYDLEGITDARKSEPLKITRSIPIPNNNHHVKATFELQSLATSPSSATTPFWVHNDSHTSAFTRLKPYNKALNSKDDTNKQSNQTKTDSDPETIEANSQGVAAQELIGQQPLNR